MSTAGMKLMTQNLVRETQLLPFSHSGFCLRGGRGLIKCHRGIGGHVQSRIHLSTQVPADSFLPWAGSQSLAGVDLCSFTDIPICKTTSGSVALFVAFIPHRNHFVAAKALGEQKICETKSPSTQRFHAAMSFLPWEWVLGVSWSWIPQTGD